ncbi:MAG: creatininase family protein [bacterium]|nr:creatininase family protein [bacterium]
MRYELMRPAQIQDAIQKGLSLLMPVGVIEYHGPQNPVGTDALISQGIVHRVEEKVDCVVAPTIFYGYTGEWAAGIEKGEVHVDGTALYSFVKPILKAFYNQGWKRIYIICHHQGPQGVTMLSYQRAATEVAMEYGLEHSGTGWHSDTKLYPFIFQRMHIVSDSQFSSQGYGGHGGRDETAAAMCLYPGTVDLEELDTEDPVWAVDAHEATTELGEQIAETIVDGWIAELGK